jgi:hypothetical protein
MTIVIDFDQHRRRRIGIPHSTAATAPVLTGDVLAPEATPAGMPVVKVRALLPGVRALPPVVRAHAARAGVAVARQGLRVVHPVTLGRLTVTVTRGAGKVIGGLAKFASGSDLHELKASKPEKHLTHLKARWSMLAGAGAGGWMLMATQPSAPWIAGAAALALCAALGRDKATPILAETPSIFGASESMIRDAFVYAKLAKSADDVRILSPVASTSHGWQTTVELPAGVTGDKAMQRRPELASALGLSTIQLAVTPDRANNRRVRLDASSAAPFSAPPVTNPLVSAPRPMDLWEPVPIGVDSAGNVVKVKLVFSGALIGGLPRMGKTVAANNLLSAAIMDPHTQLWLADGKGLDSQPIQPLARLVASRDPKSLLTLTGELIAEMERRYARLAELGLDKLDKATCHREMPLIVLWIDELRHYTHGHADANAVVADLLEIASVGPAAGIIPLFATQKPSSTVVPTDLRDLIPLRIALPCSTRDASDTILGAGAASRGANAAHLDPEQKGVSLLVGASRQPQMLRTYRVEIGELRTIAAAATALRGEATAPRGPLADVLAAMGDADRMRSADLAERLGMSADDLAAMLRPHGVRPRQLGGEGNPRGYRTADLKAAR